MLPRLHFAPKAKRVIYLFMSGGPSQIDLFDYKPKLKEHHGQELPASIRMGQRITGMTSGQKFVSVRARRCSSSRQHGKSGTWVSELLPHTATIVDDIAIVKIAEHRGDQSRPGHHVHPDRPSAARPAQPGRLAELRHRQREPATARVHRDDFAGQRQQDRPAPFLAPVGQRLSPEPAPGRAFSLRRPIRCFICPTRPAWMPGRAGACSMRVASSTAWRRRASAIRRSTPASPSTKWRTGCRPPCRS